MVNASATSRGGPIAVAPSVAARMARSVPLLFGSTILLSACLLFFVQPMVSKMILPWFGGSAAVWITAMLFFQSSLLLGYFYAHLLTRYLGRPKQVLVHLLLVASALIFLPITPAEHWLAKPGEDPTIALFLVLGSCVGLPYTLLSATSPLIQAWFSERADGALPYRYFALSNAGSLAALLAFPLAVEPRLTGHQQSLVWSWGFVAFAVLCGCSALVHLQASPRRPADPITSSERPTFASLGLWTALAACASALLLIVTNLLTQNIAPMPLLWVVPLGVYLITFILCFDGTFWYRRWVFLPLVFPALAYIATTTRTGDDPQFMKIAPLLVGALFVVCMACHGEVARMKPAPALLTNFYLAISAGGALGGLAIALIAPRIFRANYEYPIVLSAVGFVLVLSFWRERSRWRNPRIDTALWLAAAATCVVLTIYAVQEFRSDQREAKYLARNFYGALRIDEFRDGSGHHIRQLNHGTITHGTQILDAPMRHVATTYYGRDSAIGLTWRILEQAGPIRMGVIGLGTGTLASYGRAGDNLRFYDINPLVVDIARNKFTYLADTPAHVDISLGDARLTMERESAQGFDILVVDAFAGDAIPVHLLTQEAFRIYWGHMKPDGVVAVHISNRFLDLGPVVAAAAAASGRQCRLVENDDDDSHGVFESSYVLVSNRPGFFNNALLAKQAVPIKLARGSRYWTDDYSNLWQVLKFDD